MRTYSNVLNELIVILNDAVNLAEQHDNTIGKLDKLDVRGLIRLSNDANPHGDESLVPKLSALSAFADESGNRRRDILATPTPEYQKGVFNTTHKDILGSFCVESAISFLFVNTNKKFIHCYFIVNNEEKKVVKASFNETIYNESDPVMIGSIHLLNDLERGLNSLTEYK